MKNFLLLAGLLMSIQVSAQSAAGGPDAYGYTWRDSNEPNGPTASWYNITTIGTQVTGLSDDNVVGPFGWIDGFQYYWYMPTQVWIGSNGYLTFNGANIASPFPTIPSTAAPNNFIAPYLSDLNFSGASNPGKVYYHVTGDTICVSWINAPFWINAVPAYTGNNNFQVILNKLDKSITFNYQSMSGTTQSNDITIGIENITGQLGLQHSKNQYQPSNYTIKFYYPTNVTYQAVDGGVNWNMDEGNGGVFVKTGVNNTLKTNIRNFGNQNLPTINVTSSVTRTGTPTVNNSVSFTNLSGGIDTTLNLANGLNPSVTGIYSMSTSISGITGDLVPANNSLATKIIAVDSTAPAVFLDYSDGTPDGAGLSWSGGSGGIGYYIEPPFYPCRITAYRIFITADATAQGCFLKIFDDNGPNGAPGTLLDSTFAASGSFTLNSYSSVLLTNPLVINSGGFYILWEMPQGSSITMARDLTAPISYRSFEVLGGSWAGYRSRFTEDFLFSVEANQLQVEDLNMVRLNNIAPNAVLTTPTAPAITVRNAGQLLNRAVQLRYRFGTQPIVTENLFANILGPGDSLNYTFNASLSAAQTTTADLCVWLNMTGDINPLNDSICIPITYQVNNTSVNEGWLAQLKVFPNPSRDVFEVSGLLETANLSIHNMQGALVHEVQIGLDGSNYTVNLGNLAAGVYLARIQSGALFRQIRLIKQP